MVKRFMILTQFMNKLMVGQMSRCFKVACNFVNKPTKTFAACCKFFKKSMFNEYDND